jgi:hypothetical protein
MSDRPVRPEWRAAYLKRTLAAAPRGTGRAGYPASGAATGEGLRVSSPMLRRRPARRDAPQRTRPAHDSLPMSIAAMLRPVPTA